MRKSIQVLYEDESFIIFNKPSGLLVIPSPREKDNTLVNFVNKQFNKVDDKRLYPCHRLDKDTSGCIIFARGKKNQQIIMQMFHKKLIGKEYIAFVKGKVSRKKGEICKKISSCHQRKYSPSRIEKTAITRYRLIYVAKDFSVVKVLPVTGRTNQIRIHFNDIGHPLLGERVYAYGKDFDIKFRRVALHSSYLSFSHPNKNKEVKVKSKLPVDMKNFLDKQEIDLNL